MTKKYLVLFFFMILCLIPAQAVKAEPAPSLSAGELSLAAGKSRKLTVNYAQGEVLWSSSDESVAAVAPSGKVTGKAGGEAVITASVDSQTLECRVIVKSLGLEPAALTLEKGSAAVLHLSRKNISGKATWKSSDKGIASVNSKGKVTAKKCGTVTITAKADGCKATCQVKVPSVWEKLKDQYRSDSQVNQLLFVKYTGGSKARVLLYQKTKQKWKKVLACGGYVGAGGIGQAREGVPITPVGTYTLTGGFGILENPGAVLPYLKVNGNHYWCGDGHYYNQLIDIQEKPHDCAGEHLIDYVPSYNYGMFFDYNKECVLGKGSAFFLHCKSGRAYTGGCIAVSQKKMVEILQNAGPGAKICIYSSDS